MKKLILILLFIPIFCLSQEIGEILPQRFLNKMEITTHDSLKIFTDIQKDSSTIIYTNFSNKIIAIDYIFDYKYAHDNNFLWLGEYDLIAPNLFKDLDNNYYFVTNEKDKFYIRVRNASSIHCGAVPKGSR